QRLGDVIRTLRAGGFPARSHPDATRAMAVPSAVLTAFVAGMEAAGWSFERLLERRSLAGMLQAAREAVRIVAARARTRAAALLLLRPAIFRLLPLGSRIVPFNLEAYLRAHFTKVGAQTRLMLEEYVALGRRAGLPVERLEALLRP
ncbi:MAG: ketopantoate reductase, partial [Myxococcaceae bacterium]|nr:ketopantoate reductase [Myxococcaceae bacterium]